MNRGADVGPLEIRPLGREDVRDALLLSDQAGWNQTEDDWHRLLDVRSGGAIGALIQGRLVASATFASYRRPRANGRDGADDRGGREVHWIGMVITDREYRGRGIGSTILGRLMRESAARQPESVGLDATDQGVALYRRHGFVPVHPIERWSGGVRSVAGAQEAERMQERDLAEIVTLDRRVLGLDRRALLWHLFRGAAVRGWLVRREAGPVGYALLRPGRTYWHVGPAVATDDEAFSALLRSVARALEGAPVFMDAPRRETTSALLSAAGMAISRNLTRMTYGAPGEALMGEGVRLATGFEWG